jgi:nicotinate-nucleotide pyrophosphorylase (carboxylating)
MADIRDEIFRTISQKQVTAKIIAVNEGIIAGGMAARKEAAHLGLTILQWIDDACTVKNGDVIARFIGLPKQIAIAEEIVVGQMAKPSGIATAAHTFVEQAGERIKIVSGSWKKMPIALKDAIRQAVAAGGAAIRISDSPFIYLDKNYIRMLGGIAASLRATAAMNGFQKVVQVVGNDRTIEEEACEAAENGAAIVFVDTGQIDDVRKVIHALTENKLRQKVLIAFGGGICLSDLHELRMLDIDILDVGRAIIDAPLLDMRMVVEENENKVRDP